MKCDVRIGGKTRAVELARNAGKWCISLDGNSLDVDAVEDQRAALRVGDEVARRGRRQLVRGVERGVHGGRGVCAGCGARRGAPGRGEQDRMQQPERGFEGRQQIAAPMPGKDVRILANAGEFVEVGQGLLVVEAMKMQNEIRSPKSGRVEKLLVQEGQAVNAGDVLAWVD